MDECIEIPPELFKPVLKMLLEREGQVPFFTISIPAQIVPIVSLCSRRMLSLFPESSFWIRAASRASVAETS